MCHSVYFYQSSHSQVPEALMNKLLMPKIPQTNDVVFERAALNVLALSCVFRDNDFDYDKYVIKVDVG